YDAPLECIAYLTQKLKGPAYFLKLLAKIGAAELDIIPQIRRPDLNALAPFRKAYQHIKQQWPASRQAVQKALADPALNGTHYGSLKPVQKSGTVSRRDLMILSLTNAMDQYVAPRNTGYPLFKDFEKFGAQKLKTSVRKGQMAPTHDFFMACDVLCKRAAELETELQQYLVYLKKKLLDIAPSELRAHKANQNVQFFDDLLMLVRQALISKKGNPLAEAVRLKYHAALVDEFQDTDSVQYDIFSRLFADSNSLLFMIGDPKQAIYSFRGADVFSYLKAARDARHSFTLTENWRSQPNLIGAVNTLFSNVKTPFLFKDISFQPAIAGQKQVAKLPDGPPPLTLWYLDSRAHSQQDKPVTKTAATRLIAEAVAEEICRIAHPETGHWQPGDIAVLVRTNRQARRVKTCLSAKGLPSVLYSTGNIFDSHEAMEIEKILLSICEPDNLRLLNAALAMDMMGAQAGQLQSADINIQQWQDILIRIRQYHQLWRQSGFMQMFRTLLNRENVRQRLLPFADGERRMTNVLHLAEIIHQESIQRHLGIRATVKWLAEQRDARSPRLEEHQLRLESDAQAINIVTIHKSKGLEYPVVFCPYGWEGSFVKDSEIIFHRPAARGKDPRLMMDLGSADYAANLVYAQNELLAENIRLLYVALTRAKQKCYLVWGRINTAESSALAYLLHVKKDTPVELPTADRVSDLKQQIRALSDAQRLADLAALAKKSLNSIEVLALPESSDRRFWARTEDADPLSCRTFKGRIDTGWRVSSYSALVSRQIADIDQPDRDALGTMTRILTDMETDDIDLQQSAARDSIFAFPKGSRAGNFFHDIFEHLDYTDASS
ncbi:MAG: 3'-5' exonuclease, partial [Desulfobacterales bacterium]|nr:3'-5' exonuclease [Desulfobacterales bacterium]